ncbi:MAG: M55 family metallopeptidase [Gemmatimonadetes bacterium]|nr:M55 family metallopeptidase [Gemmatimonadota bacterium]
MKSHSPFRFVAAVLFVLVIGVSVVATHVESQVSPPFSEKTIPFEEGFRVYIVPDMEGMGSTVNIWEVIAGNEGERYRDLTSDDYWEHYRSLLTAETNAVIAGARSAGAESFVVNEGHGGNRFANVLPWELDPAALLIRGYPKPMVMSTAIDETFGTMMFTGAHANAGSPGVMAHNYAFAEFAVNGKVLNEIGINALVAGEMGVSVSMIAGDDVLVAETREMLGNGVIGIVVKVAVGRNAAITYSPQRVREMLQEAAAEAVRREMVGDFEPFVLDTPYNVEFTLRPSYPESVVEGVDAITEFGLEKTGERSYRFVTDDARQIAYLLDAIELVVLP